ncbi:hypothetical protein ACFL5K_05090 [Gemmatimonadota bacterium]
MNCKSFNLKGMLLLPLYITLACLTSLYGEVTGVWAVGDGEKVYRYQADHPSRQKNSVWDGSTVRLKGLYNEVLAFQVIVEADSFGARALEVITDPPFHKKTDRRRGPPALWAMRGYRDFQRALSPG